MTLHDLFTLLIIPIGTSRTNQIQYMKYISEYIRKLQIHQHSLLTRKVFSRHKSSAQVFIIGSSSKLDHHQHLCCFYIKQWCYLSNIIVIGISTKPTLFHVGCRPSLHVGIHRQMQPFFMQDLSVQFQPFFMLDVGLHLQSQPFFMLDVGLHLQSQPFFMLDVGLQCQPFFMLDVGLHLQSHPFFMLDVGLQCQPFFMLDVGLHLQSQPFFMLDVGL